MATFTLAEAKKLGLDDLQAGIAATIYTESPGLGLIPFQQVTGNSYSFNRELTLVDGQYVAADGTITDSSAMTNTLVQIPLTAISGQSDIPNLQLRQHVGGNAGNDLKAVHIASAAKGVSRKFLSAVVNGTVGANGWDGLAAIAAAFSGQVEDAANGAFSLALVDAAMARLAGRPQWIMGNAKAELAFKNAMRAAGGITSVELNGHYFMAYDGVPFIRNDYIAVDNVGGTAGNQTDIYLGSWGDGTDLGGASALTTFGDLFKVQEFPALEGKDATRVRVIMDAGFTVFSPLKVSQLHNVTV